MDSIDRFFAEDEYINLFRVFQEALNNIVKHAKASKVDLSIVKTKNKLKIIIQDNGAGFNIDDQKWREDRPRFGVSGMKERINILKGKFQIKSKPGKGTKIVLEFTEKVQL